MTIKDKFAWTDKDIEVMLGKKKPKKGKRKQDKEKRKNDAR